VPGGLVAVVLGAGAAGLTACGDTKGLIASNDSSSLQQQLDDVSSAVSDSNCKKAATAVVRFQRKVQGLPSSVDPRLKQRLTEGGQRLATQAAKDCKQTTETVPTETQTTPTVTTPPVTTPTVTTPTTTTPTTTTPTTTTPTTTTPTTPTPPDNGGGNGNGNGGGNNGNGNGNGGGAGTTGGTGKGNGGGAPAGTLTPEGATG
jgi:hypothetical protein